MKKIVFIILSSLCFADNYKLLNIEKEIVEDKIEKYEKQKELYYSRNDFLKLKKELFDKNLEIVEEKIKVTKEYYETTSQLEAILELIEISNLKSSNLKKIKQFQLELKKTISEQEFFDLENQILEEELARKLYLKEQEKLRIVLNNNSFLSLNKVNKSYYKEMVNSFEAYIIQNEQELSLFISEKRSASEIMIKKKEIEAIKINLDEKLFEFNKYTLELEKKISEILGKLEILELKIDNNKNKIKNLDNLLKNGVISQKDFLNAEINLLELLKEKIILLGTQKALKLEIETRDKKGEEND